MLSVLAAGLGFAGASGQTLQERTETTAPAARSSTLLPVSSGRLPPEAPTVIYEKGLLTISADNSTLSDILLEICSRTGADIDIPSGAGEAVVAHLGPGPARDVVYALLNGSQFNFVLVGSRSDPGALTRVVLLPRPPAEKSPQREVNTAATTPNWKHVENAEIQPIDAPSDSEPPMRAQQRMLQQHRQIVMEEFRQSQRGR
jgi:hypothetical protein